MKNNNNNQPTWDKVKKEGQNKKKQSILEWLLKWPLTDDGFWECGPLEVQLALQQRFKKTLLEKNETKGENNFL